MQSIPVVKLAYHSEAAGFYQFRTTSGSDAKRDRSVAANVEQNQATG
jgi:hypothetical protein